MNNEEKHKELLHEYFFSEEIRMEDELRQLQHNVRFRRIDDIDCHELLIATLRLESFREFRRNVLMLLNMEDN